ncbi:MAG: HlyC/CorC family transporter [Candidatus Krumholzibacteriota bacterium]|nr:HlyC/CorC family transporter [Candidatus Krumholzibacteriota bacterium]
MTIDLLIGALCLGLLGASAFFSGSETALFALDPAQRHHLRRQRDRRARHVVELLGHLREVLVSVLVGNTFVNILLAVLAARLAIRHLGPERGPAVAGVAVTAAILIFGEILPKSLSVRRPLENSLRVGGVLLRLHGLLRPLARALRGLSQRLLGVVERLAPRDDLELREQDMLALISLGVEQGGIGEKERELVRGVFELGDKTAGEVMTPRVDLFMLDAATRAREAVAPVRGAGYALVPLVRSGSEDVVGLLEVVALLGQEQSLRTLGELARPPRFCPESQRAGPLLRQLLAEGEPAALVLDEYGALAGLVSLVDLYAVLVGDIFSRHDFESRRYALVDARTLVASGRTPRDVAERLLHCELGDGEAETLAGALMEHLGELPETGRAYEHAGVRWTVLDADGPVLRTLRLERLP